MLFHLIIVYIYLFYGIISIFSDKKLNNAYLIILMFLSFKVVTNYRICSIAYLECKIRDIEREKSFMNQLLDPIVDLRYTDHIYALTLLSFGILVQSVIFSKNI